jgi:Zn-dependent membrane protease YugP
MTLWILLIVGTLGLSFFAMARVKNAIGKYSRIPAYSGLTGADAAERILAMAGIQDVSVICQNGMMDDHYDPTRKRLVLSRENYFGRSVAALGIAAHEAGHAIQHKLRYAPLEWRMVSAGLTQFVSPMIYVVPLLAVFGLLPFKLAIAGMAIGFGVLMLFNLITLPVEFDASRRAKIILQKSGMISRPIEVQGVNQVLNAAALTYVAAFVSSVGWFLYHLLPLLAGAEE